MKKVIYTLVLCCFFISCKEEVAKVKSEPEDATEKVAANLKSIEVEIEGMTCEMGCGGSIRKELKGTGGVSRVKFDFEEGRKVQTAYIYFDETVIRPEEIKNIMTSMNDKCASGTGATIDKCVIKVGLESAEVVKIPFDDTKLHHVDLTVERSDGFKETAQS